MYAVERNVPYIHISKPGRPTKYPFPHLKVGDSFFVPSDDTKAIPRVRSAASIWAKTYNRKLVTRVVDGGVRVWRVK
jgi:hypothetical protein